MNIKFHDVISDLVGVSGLKVIRAILAGERNPQALFELCDVQIQKKKRERVLASLRGTWTPEHLFALGQALAVWEFYQKLLAQCDEQIEIVLKELAGPPPSLRRVKTRWRRRQAAGQECAADRDSSKNSDVS